MGTKEDIKTLLALNTQLDDSDAVSRVEEAKIHNPAKEVSNALSDFLVARLQKIEADDQFTDLIRMHIRQRLPEASFEQLMALLHDTSMDNTRATDSLMKLFRNENSGKVITEHLRDADVSSTAVKLYNSTQSADILQALTYFNQVLAGLPSNSTKASTGEAEIVE